MWDYMVENDNDNIKPDLKSCCYVGDAAGRPKNWEPGKPRDFSCSDRKFAANIGIQFYTPEEYFLGGKPGPFDWGTCEPSKTLQEAKADLEDTYHSKVVFDLFIRGLLKWQHCNIMRYVMRLSNISMFLIYLICIVRKCAYSCISITMVSCHGHLIIYSLI